MSTEITNMNSTDAWDIYVGRESAEYFMGGVWGVDCETWDDAVTDACERYVSGSPMCEDLSAADRGELACLLAEYIHDHHE